MARAVILVVDDHDSGRFAKVRLLQRAGFEVIEAATGGDALQLARQAAPDAIVLDVNLPDISGTEVSRLIRAGSPESSLVPILQVSSTAVSSAEQVRGLDQGADVYLTEPVHPDVLVATLRALVRARRAERELAVALQGERAARQAAEEANATKNDFIATLSHELRTPLNALLGSVWQLRHTQPDEAARVRALDRIDRSASAQARLINDLLDLSRIAKGKLTLALHLVDVAFVLQDSVDAVRPAATQKHLTTASSFEPGFAIADPDRLQQVFVNLLTNAVQFTPDGGRIAVSSAIDGRDIIVRVDDSGAGIDAGFLPMVFEQFRQGEAGMSRKHGGLGLGLAVVKQLVDLHDGMVSVTSGGPDRGSSFEVRLPRELGVAVSPSPHGPVLAGVAVLLVGADAPGDLAEVLMAAGARVERVATPEEAIACLPTRECDAIMVPASLNARPLTVIEDTRSTQPALVPLEPSDRPASVVRRLSRVMRATRASAPGN